MTRKPGRPVIPESPRFEVDGAEFAVLPGPVAAVDAHPRPSVPDGIPAELAIAVPDSKWTVDKSGRRCRFPVGPGNTSCKKAAAAAMNRGRWNHRVGRIVDSWWSYCGDHLYGRWIEEGQVMHWIRANDSAGADT